MLLTCKGSYLVCCHVDVDVFGQGHETLIYLAADTSAGSQKIHEYANYALAGATPLAVFSTKVEPTVHALVSRLAWDLGVRKAPSYTPSIHPLHVHTGEPHPEGH